MLVLYALTVSQHGRRHNQKVGVTATEDHERWLRSSGAVNANGKGLLRRQEARYVEDWWCARSGNTDTYACRARAARRLIRNETNPTLRRALLLELPRRPTDDAGRKILLEQAITRACMAVRGTRMACAWHLHGTCMACGMCIVASA